MEIPIIAYWVSSVIYPQTFVDLPCIPFFFSEIPNLLTKIWFNINSPKIIHHKMSIGRCHKTNKVIGAKIFTINP